jgi:hypothetical protein
MSDFFTHFSCLFDVTTADNASRALELYKSSEANADGRRPSDGFKLSLHEEGGTKLWIRDDVSGDPELVIEFVLLCAEEFALKGLWGFAWADMCSSPRLDAFGGGAHVVDLGCRNSFAWVNTNEWMTDTLTGGDPNG